MPGNPSVLVTESSVVFRDDSSNGGVLYNPGTDRAYSVNSLGARIWAMIHEGKSPEEIIAQLQAFFTPPPSSLAQDVADFIDSLLQNKLAYYED
jgi:hypothetical protein